MRKLAILVGTLLFAYCAACLFLFAAQRSFIYQPQPPTRGIAAPTLRLPTDDGDVLVSIRSGSGPDAVLYFGGNGEQVALSLPVLASAYPEHTIYLMNYRGYGGSAGGPSEQALFADSTALLDRYRSDLYARNVTAPTLLITAERDRVVPLTSIRRLLAAFPPSVARLEIVPAAGHNSISERPEYVGLLRKANERPAAT